MNQTAKKREKKKLKLAKEKELQAILEHRKRQQQHAMQEEESYNQSENTLESDRKPLKKKTLPKKKVADASGDWEVTDKKQQVYVTDESGEDSSD